MKRYEDLGVEARGVQSGVGEGGQGAADDRQPGRVDAESERLIRHVCLTLLTAALLLAVPPANAAELRLGVAVEPDSIDPHVHNFGGNKGFMPNLFETLTTEDPHDHLVPNLAPSWR